MTSSQKIYTENVVDQKRKTILTWLPGISFEDDLASKYKSHLSGTGRWFLESQEYCNWKVNNGSGVLWIKGKHGCGKSVLASLAIKDLQEHIKTDVALAFVFCTSLQETKKTNPLVLLQSLLRQLYTQQHGAVRVLEEIFDKKHEMQTNGPDIQDTKKSIQAVILSFHQVYLVFDGMDECQEPEELSQFLLMLSRCHDPIVKILILSRPDYDDWETRFCDCQQLRADHGANDDDISNFIEQRFSAVEILVKDVFELQKIKQDLLLKCEGMFLYIGLLMDTFNNIISQNHFYRRLKRLPNGLQEIYKMSLTRIVSQSDDDEDVRELALNVLLWVANSARRLHRDELFEALVIKRNCKYIDVGDKLPENLHLTTLCCDLIEIDSNRCYSLIHSSFQDYLQSTSTGENHPLQYFEVKQVKANLILGEVCLTYLLFDSLRQCYIESTGDLVQLQKLHPFLDYAATNLGKHLIIDGEREVQENLLDLTNHPQLRKLILALFHREILSSEVLIHNRSNPLHVLSLYNLVYTAQDIQNAHTLILEEDAFGWYPLDYALVAGNREFCSWILEVHLRAKANMPNRHFPSYCPPLHMAVSYGWGDIVITLIELHIDVNKRDAEGLTPLIVAARHDSTMMAQMLLEAGANTNIEDEEGTTALHLAAVNNNKALAENLLERGAKLCPKAFNNRQTPIHLAAEVDSEAIIRLLHSTNARSGVESIINVVCKGGFTPLHVAAMHGSVHATVALIDLGACVLARDADGFLPIQLAAKGGFLEVVKILLAAEVTSLNYSGEGNSTAICMAANEGKLDVVKYLNRCGADISFGEAGREIPLHAATKQNNLELVEFLLGAAPETINYSGLDQTTALYGAASMGTNSVSYLLQKGADVEQKTANGQTPMHGALLNGDHKTVELLLTAGADAQVLGISGSSTLHYAAYSGNQNILPLLLKHHVDCNLQNQDGYTALHICSSAGNLDFIEALFSCAEFLSKNVKNKYGLNALHLASSNGHTQVVQYLIDQGVEYIRDEDQDFPMHLAARSGHTETVVVLLHYQHQSIDEQGYFKRTPLINAVLGGHTACVKLLLEYRAEPNIADDLNNSPLHIACLSKHNEIADLLFDTSTDIRAVNRFDETILNYAAAAGNREMVIKLLGRNCDGLAASWSGVTPFSQAVLADDPELVVLFQNYGFDGSLQFDNDGLNCAHLAAKNGNLQMLEKFIAAGADPSARDSTGHNALYYAAANGHSDVIRYLITSNMNIAIDKAENSWDSPLHAASRSGFYLVVEQLLKHGAQPDIPSRFSKSTPLHFAAVSGYHRIIQALILAGADPLRSDSLGIHAFSYTTCYDTQAQWLVRNTDLTLTLIESFIKAQQQQRQSILTDTVFRGTSFLLDQNRPRLVQSDPERIDIVRSLAESLMNLGDFENSKICFKEVLFPPPGTYLVLNVACKFCARIFPYQHQALVCKTCPQLIICDICYTKYERGWKAPKSPPEEFCVVEKLEIEVLELRNLLQPLLHFGPDVLCMFFALNIDWLCTKLEAYSTWETEFNGSDIYKSLERPGQKFLELVHVFWKEILQSGKFETVVENQELEEKKRDFEKLDRKYRAEKDYSKVACKGHDFLRVARSDSRPMTDSSVASNNETRMSDDYLQQLQEKYENLLSKRLEHFLDRDQPEVQPEMGVHGDVGKGPTSREVYVPVKGQARNPDTANDIWTHSHAVTEAVAEDPKMETTVSETVVNLTTLVIPGSASSVQDEAAPLIVNDEVDYNSYQAQHPIKVETKLEEGYSPRMSTELHRASQQTAPLSQLSTEALVAEAIAQTKPSDLSQEVHFFVVETIWLIKTKSVYARNELRSFSTDDIYSITDTALEIATHFYPGCDLSEVDALNTRITELRGFDLDHEQPST